MDADMRIHMFRTGFRVSLAIMAIAVLLALFLYFRFGIAKAAALLLHLRKAKLLRKAAENKPKAAEKKRPDHSVLRDQANEEASTEKLA